MSMRASYTPDHLHDEPNRTTQAAYTAVSLPMSVTMKSVMLRELKEFGMKTTTHAIPRVLDAKRRPIKIMWAIIFLVVSCIFVFHLGKLSSYYLSYPLRTSVSFKATEFEFPDVTICNLLPFSLRKLEWKDPGLVSFAQVSQSKAEHVEEEIRELLRDTEHDAPSMILSCTYNQEHCGPHNFSVLADPEFGNCFTFSPLHEVKANTPGHGLNLILYAENKHLHSLPAFENEVAQHWEASGIRLVIHERGTHPHPELKGVNVQTGVDARFALNIEKFELYHIAKDGIWRCDDDHARIRFCNRNSGLPADRIFNEGAEDCYIRVIQAFVFDRCQCLSPNHEVPQLYCGPVSENDSSTVEADYCDEHTDACFKSVQQQLNANFSSMVIQKCMPTCEQVSYMKSMSVSDWPSHITQKKIIKDIREWYRNLTAAGVNTTLDELAQANESDISAADMIRDNFLRLCIYPESLVGNQIVEELAYPFPNFIGEVGGIVGLWLGGSVLTFLEPLELLANVFLVMKSVWRLRSTPRCPDQDANANSHANGSDTESRVQLGDAEFVPNRFYAPHKINASRDSLWK